MTKEETSQLLAGALVIFVMGSIYWLLMEFN